MPYVNAIGCLMYFTTHTRLDIVFIISHLVQIMSNFGLLHWFVVKCLLHYVQATQHMGTQYFALSIPSELLFFQGWTNANCAGDPNSWQFVFGYVFLIGGDAISWQSRMQPPMVLSSIKSKYIITIATTKEALWL